MDQRLFKEGDRVSYDRVDLAKGIEPTTRRLGEVVSVKSIKCFQLEYEMYDVRWDDGVVGHGYMFLEPEALQCPTVRMS